MVALQSPLSPLASELANIAEEAAMVSRFLDMADFCGWQDDADGGRFQLWTLRKPIPGHPKGSTVSRRTLEKALFPAKYGSTPVVSTPSGFEGVESPGMGVK